MSSLQVAKKNQTLNPRPLRRVEAFHKTADRNVNNYLHFLDNPKITGKDIDWVVHLTYEGPPPEIRLC